MSEFGEIKDVELKRVELDEAIKNFKPTYEAYRGQLENQNKIDDSHEYYDNTLPLANDTRRVIHDLIQVGLKQLQRTIGQPNLQLEDSVSNAVYRTALKFTRIAQRSVASSRPLRSSSLCGARVAATAKRASLAAEASMSGLVSDRPSLTTRRIELATKEATASTRDNTIQYKFYRQLPMGAFPRQ